MNVLIDASPKCYVHNLHSPANTKYRNLSVGGKALREIYEVANHDRAFSYVKRAVAEGRLLDEEMLKDIHALLMENIMVGGVYRSVEVRITGAGFRPSAPQEMFQQMRWFFADMPRQREKLNAIEWAAWTHAEFVRIHPFRTATGARRGC